MFFGAGQKANPKEGGMDPNALFDMVDDAIVGDGAVVDDDAIVVDQFVD